LILAAYVMLAQEPWCFTPEQIGKLTDWQIENLYAKPAMKRAEEMRKEMPDGGAPSGPSPAPVSPTPRRVLQRGPDFEPGTDGHRRQCIAAFMQVQGLNKERAVAQYERQLAQWHAEQGK
jgi:hypothetical protein